ncbi:hypothetical protein Cfor_01400 [Coptotermes formosanus]|uniref:Ionotropic glutamate receptor C-terminal domain-containing protein n=1 Tax=Coptotermes formosanus TaxID=36987 RepID=A0A6L2PQR6_COPFO|nr:hypothetical protein Cfor_01400 [Coptotermes formosanus]
MDELLQNTHKRITWPVITSFLEAAMPENTIVYKHQSYIILLWAEERDDLINTLESQVENTKSYGPSFNRWGKFLVVVTDFGVQSPEALAMSIIKNLWDNHQIANSVIMIPNLYESVIRFDLYTWFPYESGQCGTIEEVVLLDRCILEKDRALSTNISLFSSKIPLNVHGCPIRVSTWDRHPNMILDTHNETNGSITYSGIEAVYLLLLSETMNMTIIYLPPPEKEMYLAEFFIYSLSSVFSGQADIAMGNFPLHYLPLAYCEPTIPYVYGTFKWYVQCARPIRRIDNLINLFTAPAWSVLVLLLILSAVTFWCIANSPHTSMTKESIVYRYLSECFTNTWAVFLGVSVPEMPRNFRLRIYFFLFVCYCFVISTVFQAYFTSFLIEPKFEKQIHTFEELQSSESRYLEHPSMQELGTYMNYDKYKKLRKCYEKCPDYGKCLSRLLDGEKATMLMLDLWAEYAASKSRRGQASLCPIDQTEFSMGLTMYLSKGSLFRDRFNVLIQRCFEAGLGKIYWSQLTWKVSLNKSHEHGGGEAANDSNVYFAFTVYHLRVAFCLLAFGGALSCIVFMAELLTKLHFTRLRLV